eukprot:13041-Heterococcus_DN1.PRE.2
MDPDQKGTPLPGLLPPPTKNKEKNVSRNRKKTKRQFSIISRVCEQCVCAMYKLSVLCDVSSVCLCMQCVALVYDAPDRTHGGLYRSYRHFTSDETHAFWLRDLLMCVLTSSGSGVASGSSSSDSMSRF